MRRSRRSHSYHSFLHIQSSSSPLLPRVSPISYLPWWPPLKLCVAGTTRELSKLSAQWLSLTTREVSTALTMLTGMRAGWDRLSLAVKVFGDCYCFVHVLCVIRWLGKYLTGISVPQYSSKHRWLLVYAPSWCPCRYGFLVLKTHFPPHIHTHNVIRTQTHTPRYVWLSFCLFDYLSLYI